MYNILIVDRYASLYTKLKACVSNDPVSFYYHADVNTIRDALQATSPHVVLLDFDSSDDLNSTALDEIINFSPACVCIAISFLFKPKQMMQSATRGLSNCVLRSYPIHQIYNEIIQALDLINSYNHQPPEGQEAPYIDQAICGKSDFTKDVKKFILKSAQHDALVMLLGESGTGKDLIAETIHKSSDRANYMFLSVNCAAIPESLMEGEMFGTESGSFTGSVSRKGKFELAHRGTLFLNEIGETSLHFQAKLLTVLENQQFMRLGGTNYIQSDARIIVATNVDLKKMIQEKTFREDLYYRIMVVPKTMMPIRKRKEDVSVLAWHLLRKKLNYTDKFFNISALEKLLSHDWPGNVRELQNCIHRAAINSEGNAIHARDIQFV